MIAMNAVVLERYDAPLKLTRIERPGAGDGEVLVRVKASGVNPLDIKIRSGAAAHARHLPPAVLGLDLAGVVEAVGTSVTAFKPGDEVYGLTGGLQGSLAEFAAVDADLLAQKPRNLSMREAAALPLVVITAWEGLVDRATVHARQKVLVQGAGGVGQIVIQLARAFGADAFAVDGKAKHAVIGEFGATAIDRQSRVEDYVGVHTGGRGFDIVYDTVGALDASFNAVRRFGHVVSSLGWGTYALAPLSFRAATYSGVFSLLPMLIGEGRAHHGEILREATKLAEAGKLSPRVDPRHFDLTTVDEAHRALEERNGVGKIVVDVAA
jgi:NADPH:quinone reductase